MGSAPPSTAAAARTRVAFLLLVLALLLAVPWPGAAAQGGYRVVSVARAGGQLSARLELAGDGEKAELGPDVQRLSLTARQAIRLIRSQKMRIRASVVRKIIVAQTLPPLSPFEIRSELMTE
ncbi:putative alpha-glucosidase [Panicum miliaceum]|uniref:Alpha-glucosidase n=1 Tax=Panicum miliaceum TaxID=4540 RepID=A0A3L6RWV6_PANMI|nr:putative alpha-glucosidase [Panicum miliaceum]